MTRRQYLLLATGFILILLNAWRWWPSQASKPAMTGRASQSRQFRLEQFDIKMMPGVDAAVSKRDIFRPKQVAAMTKKKPPPAPPTPPPKTLEELEIEAAQAELAQFKCVGVVFRAGKGQAFILLGDQTFLVFTGDKVGKRFTVEQITADVVSLKDPNTSVSGKIIVSGK